MNYIIQKATSYFGKKYLINIGIISFCLWFINALVIGIVFLNIDGGFERLKIYDNGFNFIIGTIIVTLLYKARKKTLIQVQNELKDNQKKA